MALYTYLFGASSSSLSSVFRDCKAVDFTKEYAVFFFWVSSLKRMCTMLGLILVLDERESRSLKPHEHLITHWSYATVYHSVPGKRTKGFGD